MYRVINGSHPKRVARAAEVPFEIPESDMTTVSVAPCTIKRRRGSRAKTPFVFGVCVRVCVVCVWCVVVLGCLYFEGGEWGDVPQAGDVARVMFAMRARTPTPLPIPTPARTKGTTYTPLLLTQNHRGPPHICKVPPQPNHHHPSKVDGGVVASVVYGVPAFGELIQGVGGILGVGVKGGG